MSDVGAGSGAAAGAVAGAGFGAVGGVGTSIVALHRVCVDNGLLAFLSGTYQFRHMATFSRPSPCVFCLLLCMLPDRTALLMAFRICLLGLSLPWEYLYDVVVG